MTVCTACNGSGRRYDGYEDIFRECDRCHGSGEVDMTNEEWLRSASTEQLAEFLNDCRFYFDGLKIVSAKYQDMKIEDIPLEWLKQPHTPKE